MSKQAQPPTTTGDSRTVWASYDAQTNTFTGQGIDTIAPGQTSGFYSVVLEQGFDNTPAVFVTVNDPLAALSESALGSYYPSVKVPGAGGRTYQVALHIGTIGTGGPTTLAASFSFLAIGN
ncbi:MAG: hypothetical protein AAF481_20100 [Acidobacteriota bacterium]